MKSGIVLPAHALFCFSISSVRDKIQTSSWKLRTGSGRGSRSRKQRTSTVSERERTRSYLKKGIERMTITTKLETPSLATLAWRLSGLRLEALVRKAVFAVGLRPQVQCRLAELTIPDSEIVQRV